MTNTLDLKRSKDRKTTPSATPSGKVANVSNAFGLLSGRDYSCPAQTSACEKVCYAGRLEKVFTGFRKVMEHNYNAVKNASYEDLVSSLDSIIKDFIKESDKRKSAKVFRIHHDGDFFSNTYAKAWATVMLANPAVTFWAYTRSFTPVCNVVAELADVPNLTLYLSVDSDNETYAKDVLTAFPRVRVATLTDTASEGKRVMVSLGRKVGGACPEVLGRIPLITNEGGACFSCGLCITGKSDIRFASKGVV